MKSVGGMQRVSLQLLRQFRAHANIEVWPIVLTAPSSGAMIELGPAIRTAGFMITTLARLPGLVRECNPDLILFSSMVTATLSILLKKLGVPMVTITHGHDVVFGLPLYQRLVKAVLQSVAGVISVSSATRQACLERGLPPSKNKVIPNGFSFTGQAYPNPKKARRIMAKQLNADLSDKAILLTVGRLARRKGHAWFIEQVLPKIRSSLVYVIIGAGPEETTLRRAIKKSGCSDRVFYLGKQPEEMLRLAYAAADLFVMPNIPVRNDLEGFGVVLLEANAAGTPAIASDLEGIQDVISPGENGFRVPPLQPELFASKIDEILENGTEELGKEARRFIDHRFSWPVVTNHYYQFLAQLISQNTTTLQTNEVVCHSPEVNQAEA